MLFPQPKKVLSVFYQRKCPQSQSLLCFVLYLYSKFHFQKFNAKAVRSAFLENDYLGHCLTIWSKNTLRMFAWSSFDGQDMFTISRNQKASAPYRSDHGIYEIPLCPPLYSLSLRNQLPFPVELKTAVEERAAWRSATFLINACKHKES